MDLNATLEAVRTDPNVVLPSSSEIFTGGDIENFLNIGVDIALALVRDAGLRADSDVLEIGSGLGRPAIPLTRVLTQGTYHGIEIVGKAVDWCRQNISAHYPNFSFHHYDIHNAFYNPQGVGWVATTRLPFPDNSFDIVFMASVMTHLNIEDARAYLAEIHRVLKPGGRLWATWFIVDQSMEQTILEAGNSRVPLGWTGGDGVYYTNAERNTLAVAFRESLVRAMHAESRLQITSMPRGEWCAREKVDGGFQDLVVAMKQG